MKKKLLEILKNWPKNYITYNDIAVSLTNTDNAIRSLLKRCVDEGLLIRIKKEFYVISKKIKNSLPDNYELASLLYGPSYISFESALSFHGWIIEGVFSTTSSTIKKTKEISTPIGSFLYYHIPIHVFSLGLDTIEINKGNVFIANPWKAIADLIYMKKKNWPSIISFANDMRIEFGLLQDSDLGLLEELSLSYPNNRTKKILKCFFKELTL